MQGIERVADRLRAKTNPRRADALKAPTVEYGFRQAKNARGDFHADDLLVCGFARSGGHLQLQFTSGAGPRSRLAMQARVIADNGAD